MYACSVDDTVANVLLSAGVCRCQEVQQNHPYVVEREGHVFVMQRRGAHDIENCGM